MNTVVFIAISTLYVLSLAIIDGLFNRLVFRNKRKHSYFSFHKKKIYQHWEWQVIGIIFLIFLPIVLPSFISYALGGISYLTLYWIILLLVPWDMVFGGLVFDDIFGDTPSIALPRVGWIQQSLLFVTTIRLSLVALLFISKVKFGI